MATKTYRNEIASLYRKSNTRWIDKLRVVERHLIELDLAGEKDRDQGPEAGFDGSAGRIRRVV
jgi:hypothetical protein